MIAPARPIGTKKYADAIEHLQQQVNELQAKLSAESESYRLIISTMATTCRTLQARVRTLEGERLESVGEEDRPPSTGISASLAGNRARRRHTARAMSWPTIISETSIIRRETLNQPDSMALASIESRREPLSSSPCPHTPVSYSQHASVDDLVFYKACQSWF